MSDDSTLRILVYNTRHCRGAFSPFVSEKRIADVIVREHADVVGLTEIYRTSNRDQVERLGELTGLDTLFHGVREVPGGEYGNLLLSRHPLSAMARVPLPGKREMRGCLIAEVRLPFGAVAVALTHLGLDAATRQSQIAEIRRALPTGRPLVLMGDFNGPAKELEPLEGVLHGFSRLPRTFPSFAPLLGLDRILFSRDFEPLELRSPFSLASDHRPLVAELDWSTH